MAKDNTKSRLWNKNFILIAVASTGVSFATYFFLSSLPIYAERITGSTQWAGAMTGVYSLAALASRPVAGYLADRLNRRAIAFAGALICLISCILYNFAGLIVILLIFRFVHGFGFGIHTTSANTIIVDMVPPEKRIEGIGSFGICMTVASAIAPAIALPIITNNENGLRKLTVMASVLLVASLVSILLARHDTVEPHEERSSPVKMNEHYPAEKGGAMQPAIMLLLVATVQGAVVSFLALYALEIGYASIGFFFTLSAIGMILSRLFAGRISDKRGVRVVMLPSLFIYLLSLLGIAFTSNQMVMILLGFPFGLALGSITPAFNVIILSRFPDSRRGAASGLYFACLDAGIGGGSIVWGFFADIIKYRGIFMASAGICALLLVWYIFAGSKQKRIEREDG